MEGSGESKFGTILIGDTTTLANKTPAHQAAYTCALTLFAITLILSMISLIFGAISWIVLSKWRKFDHYVFLSLIFASAINMMGFNLYTHYKLSPIVIVLLLLVPRIIVTHWLFVTISMLYLDIVKVNNNEISRKYLKANIFCWILPFVEVLFVYAIEYYFEIRIVVSFNYGVNILLLVITFVLYLSVLRSIVKITLAQSGTWRYFVEKILLACGFSVPSGLSTLFPILVLEVLHVDMVMYNLGLIVCMLTISIGNIGFLCLRRHRELWAEYRRRRETIKDVYKNTYLAVTTARV